MTTITGADVIRSWLLRNRMPITCRILAVERELLLPRRRHRFGKPLFDGRRTPRSRTATAGDHVATAPNRPPRSRREHLGRDRVGQQFADRAPTADQRIEVGWPDQISP